MVKSFDDWLYKVSHRKIYKSGNSLSIRIPTRIIEVLDLKENDLVKLEVKNDKLIIFKDGDEK